MAYLQAPNFNDDEEEKKTNEQVLSSGSSASGGASPSSSAAKPAQAAGTGFVNIQRYLGANEGGGQKMAEGITGNVQGQIDTANKSVSDLSGRFNEGASQSFDNSGLIKDIESQGVGGRVQQIQEGRAKQYTGPNELVDVDGYGESAGQIDRAQKSVGRTEDSAGRYQLLSDTFSRPSYNRGEKSLDNAIVTADEGARSHLDNFRSDNANVGESMSNAEKQARNLSDTRKKEADNAQSALNRAINNRNTAMQNDLEAKRASQANILDTSERQMYADSPIARAAAEAGLDINQYRQRGSGVGFGDVASEEQKSEYQALLELMGGQDAVGYDMNVKGANGARFDRAKLDRDMARIALQKKQADERSARELMESQAFNQRDPSSARSGEGEFARDVYYGDMDPAAEALMDPFNIGASPIGPTPDALKRGAQQTGKQFSKIKNVWGG